MKNKTISKALVDKLKYEVITKLDPNEKLPSERKMMTFYKVSRTTVRKALDDLELLGYIYRQRGRGTFVAYRPKNVTNLADTFSFSKGMKEKGITTDTKVLFLKEKHAKEYQANMLNISVSDPIYELKRIRYANGEPMIVERTYLNKEIFTELTVEELQNKSLYDLFKNKFKIDIYTADETCTASLASANDNAVLGGPVGTPFLKLERLTSDRDSRIVEFTLSMARADKFTYHVKQYYQGNE